MTASDAKRGEKVEFSAVNVFAGDNNANLSFPLPVAADVYARVRQGLAGPTALCGIPVTTAALLQNMTTYENFEIAGHKVVASIVTGMHVEYADGHTEGTGFEWGILDSGDHYLSEIHETMVDQHTRGTWKLIYGSGVLAGIEGEASYTNNPKPGLKAVRSHLDGYYVLPPKAHGAGQDIT